jgi:hypothetical protein
MKALQYTTVLTALLGLLSSACERKSGPIEPGLGGGIGSLDVTALQSAPSNDNFSSATVIAALPFTNTVDITEATTEPPDERAPSCAFGSASGRTVWYSFTTPATAGVISASITAGISTVVAAYTGASLAALTEAACRSPYQGPPTLTFLAAASTTYYFQVDGMFGQSGSLTFQLEEIPPPPNDDFANATVIGGLPFSNVINTMAATTQSGEPASSCSGSANQTAWYSFTPSQTRSISASAVNASFYPVVTAYTGNTLSGLTELGCRAFGGQVTFHAEAGTTYYLRVGSVYSDQGGSVEFRLVVTPPPVAQFNFSPSDPSPFDAVQFYGYYSYDPGEVGIQSYQWDFGDGAATTTPNCCVTHQYASDGDYTVQLAVTTFDGRTGSTSQTVLVRTHDVAITKFSVPKSASADQTRQIVVGLNSRRYPETVEVQLFKSVPGGYQQVGSLTQSVPVRASNRTTDFSFSYTFTGADAQVGKVTFRAVANLLGARDALPADNEAIASPTKVSR